MLLPVITQSTWLNHYSAVVWQKETTLEKDISRKWAKCVYHVHWHNAILSSLDLNFFQQDECFCSKFGLEVENTKSDIKTLLSQIWEICDLLPFVRVGKYSHVCFTTGWWMGQATSLGTWPCLSSPPYTVWPTSCWPIWWTITTSTCLTSSLSSPPRPSTWPSREDPSLSLLSGMLISSEYFQDILPSQYYNIHPLYVPVVKFHIELARF